MRTKYLLALLALLDFSLAQASSAKTALLVREPGVAHENFLAYAKANGRRTLAEDFDLNRPGQEAEQRLNRLIAKAQEFWLSDSVENARSAFHQIALLALEADWRPAQQEAIHYSILRLAQITTVPTEREAWLSQAANLFPATEPDRGLFPPPLLESYQAAKSRALAQARGFAPSKLFPGYEIILINGRRHEITPDLKVHIGSGAHRVTVLSNTHAAITERLTASQLEIFRAQVEPLVSGSCDEPQVSSSFGHSREATLLNDIDVFFSPECVRMRRAGTWISRESDIADLQRFSATLAKPHPPRSGELNLPWSQETATTVASSSKRNWLWASATALAIGAAYVIHREATRAEPVVQPVHREGF